MAATKQGNMVALDTLFEEAKTQWTNALNEARHPFRYFVLGTSIPDHYPQIRTVVLRDFDSKNLVFTIYTDNRTQKIKDLTRQPKAQLLFYHPEEQLQLRVSCTLMEMQSSNQIFQGLPQKSQRDYTVNPAPGNLIDSPESISYGKEALHFRKLRFQAQEMEYLKIQKPMHIRALFFLSQDWKGQFIVP